MRRIPLEIRLGRLTERASQILQGTDGAARSERRADEARETFRAALRAIPENAQPRRRAQLLEAAVTAYEQAVKGARA